MSLWFSKYTHAHQGYATVALQALRNDGVLGHASVCVLVASPPPLGMVPVCLLCCRWGDPQIGALLDTRTSDGEPTQRWTAPRAPRASSTAAVAKTAARRGAPAMPPPPRRCRLGPRRPIGCARAKPATSRRQVGSAVACLICARKATVPVSCREMHTR